MTWLSLNRPWAFVLLSLVALWPFAEAQVPEPQIAGRVVRGDNGLPIADAVIKLVPSWGSSNGQFQSTISDGHGEYRFVEKVPDGIYNIVATAEGFVDQTYNPDATVEGVFQRVNESTRLREVDFQLKREAVIRGVLTDAAGNPLRSGVSVAAVRKEKRENGSDRLRPVNWVRTDASGRFVLAKLPSGTYFVCVNGPNGFDARQDSGGWYRETWYGNVSSVEGAIPVVLKEGDTQNGVRITVERERRYRVLVWPSGPEGDPKPTRYDVDIEGRSLTYTREASGAYIIPGIPPGQYRLVSMAWSESQYLGEGDMTFDVIDSDVSLHLRLGGLGEIQGLIKSEGGRVPSGLMLGIESREGAAQGSEVDTAGHFMFGRVLPGEYEFKQLKMPVGIVLSGVQCGGVEVTRNSPLRVGDRQKITDCTVLVGQEPSQNKSERP